MYYFNLGKRFLQELNLYLVNENIIVYFFLLIEVLNIKILNGYNELCNCNNLSFVFLFLLLLCYYCIFYIYYLNVRLYSFIMI